jgi:hypothetical protein
LSDTANAFEEVHDGRRRRDERISLEAADHRECFRDQKLRDQDSNRELWRLKALVAPAATLSLRPESDRRTL